MFDLFDRSDCLLGFKLLWIAVNSCFSHFPVRPVLHFFFLMSFFSCSFIHTAIMCFLDYCILILCNALRMSVMNIRDAICSAAQNGPNWNAETTALANQLRDVAHSWQIIKRILSRGAYYHSCNESSYKMCWEQWRDGEVWQWSEKLQEKKKALR